MVLALVSLVVSMYVGYRYVGLIDCLQRQAAADANRTKAIAEVTDRERAADLALIMGPTAERSAAALREAATEARRETDRVRAANPAPTAVPCD
ncbi:hypothetical protein [Brevundimonas sp.]|uniref:hypothetical protein n=1 Tax=Brevundimonas sp. TaxID=1871086 RepID=UPI002D259185|nr:hypothetical protein [Brevundimonas sp.]HYD28890.1 hypothetical protein [Brevundimonas sp.]